MKPGHDKLLTPEHVAERTVEEGNCLVWTGSMVNGHDPRMKLAGERINVRRVLFCQHHGRPPRADYFVRACCKTPGCVEPAHLEEVSQSKATRGIPKSMATRAKIANTKRKSGKVSAELAQAIRLSDRPSREEAALHGLHKSAVNFIRNNKMLRDYSTPWAGLGA